MSLVKLIYKLQQLPPVEELDLVQLQQFQETKRQKAELEKHLFDLLKFDGDV